MNKNSKVKKSFPIAGIFFALYGILLLAMDLYYSIVSVVMYKTPLLNILPSILSSISYYFLFLGLIFIGFSIMLFLVKDNPAPALIMGGIVSVAYFFIGLSNLAYIIEGLLNDPDNYFGDGIYSIKYFIADIIADPFDIVLSLAIAVFTLYILIAWISNKKNKRSKILSLWFIPCAVYFIATVAGLICSLISNAIYEVDFLYLIGIILYSVIDIVLTVGIALYCMSLNKENKQYAIEKVTEAETETKTVEA
ncbi:MAG: hypothetical protein IKT46_07870 [Clostridia bacterium]|nr:hypothetical protein [Clostridia bacterium]